MNVSDERSRTVSLHLASLLLFCSSTQATDMQSAWNDYLLNVDESRLVGRSIQVELTESGAIDEDGRVLEDLDAVPPQATMTHHLEDEGYVAIWSPYDDPERKIYLGFDGTTSIRAESIENSVIRLYEGEHTDEPVLSPNLLRSALGVLDSADFADLIEPVSYDAANLLLVARDKSTGRNEIYIQFAESEDGIHYLVKKENYWDGVLQAREVYTDWQFPEEPGAISYPMRASRETYAMGELMGEQRYRIVEMATHPEDYELPSIPMEPGQWVYDHHYTPPLHYQYKKVKLHEEELADLVETKLPTLESQVGDLVGEANAHATGEGRAPYNSEPGEHQEPAAESEHRSTWKSWVLVLVTVLFILNAVFWARGRRAKRQSTVKEQR